MEPSLLWKQNRFSSLVAGLILKAQELGYQVTFGEAYRTPEQAKIYADDGRGVVNSLHRIRLAIDLNLFLDAKFLTQTKDYEPLGVWWEEQSTQDYVLCWGGRFLRQDGNHFSMSHAGVK